MILHCLCLHNDCFVLFAVAICPHVNTLNVSFSSAARTENYSTCISHAQTYHGLQQDRLVNSLCEFVDSTTKKECDSLNGSDICLFIVYTGVCLVMSHVSRNAVNPCGILIMVMYSRPSAFLGKSLMRN